MLTKQLILAVLQGLPASSLPHLAEPYRLFCERIESALKHEVPPLPALNYALTEASPRETRDLIRTLKETLLIQDQSLPSLSKRQKEVLVALRLFGRLLAPNSPALYLRIAATRTNGWLLSWLPVWLANPPLRMAFSTSPFLPLCPRP